MSTIDVDNIQDSNGDSLDTTYVTKGSAKAAVNGTSAAGVNASVNISSGTDNGTGQYEYALTNAFSNINYYHVSMPRTSVTALTAGRDLNHDTASIIAVRIESDSSAATDAGQDHAAFGDLA